MPAKMVCFAALNVLSSIQRQVRSRHDDVLTDRLHYAMAPAVLLSLAGLHGLNQYFGRPIECWPPAEMDRSQWLDYMHAFCFVDGTYFVGFNEHFPIRRVDRDHRQLHYYQWVPFVLLAQALLLILPKAIWFLFIQKNGFSVSYLLDKLAWTEKEDENAIRREFGPPEEFAVRIARDRRDQLCFRKGIMPLEWEPPKKGSSQSLHQNSLSLFLWWLNDQKLTFGYISYKVANLIIVVLQLYLLNSYFGADGRHTFWALNVLTNLTAGRDWHESGQFPRVTFCDLQIRSPQRNMKPLVYTFQCLLNMNMLNEKILLFVLLALVALAVANSFNLALWLYRCFIWRSADQFIRDELRKIRKQNDISMESNSFHDFVRHSLGRDTVTLLHIVNANCLPLTSAKMIGQLWHYHKKVQMLLAQKMSAQKCRRKCPGYIGFA